MDTTKALAEFLVSSSIDEFPEAVLEHATRMIIDTVGVTIVGSGTEISDIVVEDVGMTDGPATVLGRSMTATPADAAFVNGIQAHALDFDDVHKTMGGHPSAPILPVVFALGETEGASGEDVLEAFVLGAEAEIRLAVEMNPGLYERGWHPTAIVGHVGAAAAAGKLLGLDSQQMRNALGIACSQAGGIKGNFGTMSKPYHVGNAARSGIEASTLAEAGFTANETVLEADFGGYFDLFSGGQKCKTGKGFSDLGSEWHLLDPKVGFKAYPCCGSTHAPLDAIRKLSTEDVQPAHVESIEIRECPPRLPHTDKPNPTTPLEAKFSVQYVTSVMLATGTVWLDDFTKDAITSDEIRSLMETVTVISDESMPEWGAKVTVRTNTDTLVSSVDRYEELTDQRLERKYERCIEKSKIKSESLDDLKHIVAAGEISAVLEALSIPS